MGPLLVSSYLALLLCSYAAYISGDIALTRLIRKSSGGGGSGGGDDDVFYLSLYVACSVGHVALLVVTSAVWAMGGVRASRSLYADTVGVLSRAPLWWYDLTPSGRIMSRYTSDVGSVDTLLTVESDNLGQMSVMTSCLVGLIISQALWLTPVCLAAVVLFVLQTVAVDKTCRELRRMSNNTVSPIISGVHEMGVGGALIRGMGLAPYFVRRAGLAISEWSRMFYLTKATQNWGNHATNFIAVCVGGSTAFFLMATRGERDAELAGLALTYGFLIPYFLMVVGHHFMQTRTAMASLERLLEYLHLPQEEAATTSADPPPAAWPTAGKVEFRSLEMRYRPSLPLVVAGLSATIEGGQKAGIVGRTGSGKSSLMLALFRLVEASGGAVLIDGVDVSGIGIEALRRAVTIVPQEATLFRGTVAHNLDPFKEKGEEELREVLRRTRLPESMLHSQVDKGGNNLSSGERQLLCFARALLQRRSVLVLDEATSNLDVESDARIQKLLRTQFDATTILTIAHRLQTIIDYDVVLVLGAGKLLEQGSPSELAATENGAFAAMVDAAGGMELLAAASRRDATGDE